LFFTLSLRDIGYGESEKHVWKSSYPLLDLLYPHWVGKVPMNTPIDFLHQSLKHAEQSFGWKFVESSKRFMIPEESFGNGVSRVVLTQETHNKGLLNTLATDRFTVLNKRTEKKLSELVTARASIHETPFVVIVANFLSIEIVECIPRKIGAYVRWEYKTSRLAFDSKQQFVDYVVAKRFMPFVSEHMSENLLFNTIMNYSYWQPVTTSSLLVKDLWRALLTSMFGDLSVHTTMGAQSRGSVYLTGEIPAFLQDTASMQLALVDGLGLSGAWTVVVDDHYQLIPQLYDTALSNPFMGFSQEGSVLWIIPQSKSTSIATEVTIEDTKVQSLNGNLYNYSRQENIHAVEVKIGAAKTEVELKKWMNVKQIIIDKRPWPVVYGPNTVANSVKIPQWLSRLKNHLAI
jgi:hypothetical protein